MKIIKKEIAFHGFYKLNELTIQSEKTEKVSVREQFQAPNSVAVLVHDVKTDEIILVRQFRIGVEGPLLEIVAGKIEDIESSLEDTAKREVLEEVGYKIDTLEYWHEFYPAPGPVTEKMTLFYAQVTQQIEAGGGLDEENEEIEIVRMKKDDFLNHSFTDAKTLIAQLQLNKLQ